LHGVSFVIAVRHEFMERPGSETLTFFFVTGVACHFVTPPCWVKGLDILQEGTFSGIVVLDKVLYQCIPPFTANEAVTNHFTISVELIATMYLIGPVGPLLLTHV